MPVRIAICDDSLDDIKGLTEALYAYDASFQISAYTHGETLVADWSEQEVLFDLIFLDIYMPGLNGIQTAKKIREGKRDVKIIFVTSSNEHYPEAYDIFAFNYLIKPMDRTILYRVLNQALKGIMVERRQQYSFTYKGTSHRVFCRDILYLESLDKLILLHLSDGTTLQCYDKLDDLMKHMPEKAFVRCHQSFAVNIYFVDKMGEHHFQIGQTLINISKRYFKISKEKYLNVLFALMDRGAVHEK